MRHFNATSPSNRVFGQGQSVIQKYPGSENLDQNEKIKANQDCGQLAGRLSDTNFSMGSVETANMHSRGSSGAEWQHLVKNSVDTLSLSQSFVNSRNLEKDGIKERIMKMKQRGQNVLKSVQVEEEGREHKLTERKEDSSLGTTLSTNSKEETTTQERETELVEEITEDEASPRRSDAIYIEDLNTSNSEQERVCQNTATEERLDSQDYQYTVSTAAGITDTRGPDKRSASEVLEEYLDEAEKSLHQDKSK